MSSQLNFRHKLSEAATDDHEGPKHIINQRRHGVQKEYLCIFDEKVSKWLPVPVENEILATYLELDAKKTPEGPEVIDNLSELVQVDLIPD